MEVSLAFVYINLMVLVYVSLLKQNQHVDFYEVNQTYLAYVWFT